MTSRDEAYIREQFAPLESICAVHGHPVGEVRQAIAEGRLPAPSYQLGAGTEMVPRDYFMLIDFAGGEDNLERWFRAHYRGDDVDGDRRQYIDGVYGVCLKHVTPENIVRKGSLVTEISSLLEAPRPSDTSWRTALRRAVDELDQLERPFAPDYDRVAFATPPSRDRLIARPKVLYRDLWHTEDADGAEARGDGEPQLFLRRATLGDNEVLLAINRRAAVAAYRHVFPPERYPFPDAAVRDSRARQLQSSEHIFLVAERGGEPVGFASSTPGTLSELYVVPEEWGRGVAADLHDAAVADAGAETVEVRLLVLAANERARRFYERRGWRQDGREERSRHPPYPLELGYELQPARVPPRSRGDVDQARRNPSLTGEAE